MLWVMGHGSEANRCIGYPFQNMATVPPLVTCSGLHGLRKSLHDPGKSLVHQGARANDEDRLSNGIVGYSLVHDARKRQDIAGSGRSDGELVPGNGQPVHAKRLDSGRGEGFDGRFPMFRTCSLRPCAVRAAFSFARLHPQTGLRWRRWCFPVDRHAGRRAFGPRPCCSWCRRNSP